MHGLCNLLSLHCQRGAKISEVGHSRPINKTMPLCRVIGNVHTDASVCVAGGEYELGVYADGESLLGVYTHVGVKNVIWYVGRGI